MLQELIPVIAKADGYEGTPWWQSGTSQFISYAKKNGLITSETLSLSTPAFPGMFGGYPFPMWDKGERAADGVLIAVFFILMVAHAYIFVRNRIHGQRFYFSFGVAFVCMMKIVGFSCRLAWSHDITSLRVGITSVVFIQVAQLILLGMNMVLAHRIFTWRHPETGNSLIFNLFMIWVYCLVLIIIAMAIVGQSIPYLYFLGHHNYNMCRNVVKAAAILNLYFAAMPIQLLFFGFLLPPGFAPSFLRAGDDIPPVHQATWIKSAHLLYFPEHNSQVFVTPNFRNTIRIIPSREPPGKGIHKNLHEPMHPDSPRISRAVLAVAVSSVVLVFTTCFRVAAVFRGDSYGTSRADGSVAVAFWPWEPYVQFIFYGGVEAAVIIWYLLMRVDLRFYIPEITDMVEGNPVRGQRSNSLGASSHEDESYELKGTNTRSSNWEKSRNFFFN